jgi:hypothetical protein
MYTLQRSKRITLGRTKREFANAVRIDSTAGNHKRF